MPVARVVTYRDPLARNRDLDLLVPLVGGNRIENAGFTTRRPQKAHLSPSGQILTRGSRFAVRDQRVEVRDLQVQLSRPTQLQGAGPVVPRSLTCSMLDDLATHRGQEARRHHRGHVGRCKRRPVLNSALYLRCASKRRKSHYNQRSRRRPALKTGLSVGRRSLARKGGVSGENAIGLSVETLERPWRHVNFLLSNKTTQEEIVYEELLETARCDICGEPLGGEPRAEVYRPDESDEDVYLIHQSCLTDDYEVA
jgi:hypothetical protein